MSLRNIIPEKIHPNIWKNGMGDIDDIILSALSIYSPMMRSELISDDDTRRLNKNTFHGHAKELKRKGLIDSYMKGKNSYYKILPLGDIQLSKNLHKYDLDFETRLKIEENKNKNLVSKFSKFFNKYELYHVDIQLEFLKLASVITHDKLNMFTEEEFYELVLFLTLNHPRFYRNFSVSKEDFIKDIKEKTNRILSKNYIDTFIELVVDKKFYGIGFHKLKIEETNKELFFAENSEYGELFKIIVENRLKDLIFLRNLGNIDLDYQQLQRTYEEIIRFLIDKSKLFHPDFKNSLYTLIDNWRQTIKLQIIKRVPDGLVEYTMFSLLPERKIVPRLVYPTEDIKEIIEIKPLLTLDKDQEVIKAIKRINEIKLLLTLGKDQEAIGAIKKIISQNYIDGIQEALIDLVIDLVNNEKIGIAKTIIEETTKTGKDLSEMFKGSYESKVYDEMRMHNYSGVLKLIKNFENFIDNYEDYELGIIFNKIFALEELGRSTEALEFIDLIHENWEQFGVFINGEVFPDFSDFSELFLNTENIRKSYFYDFGILKSQIFLRMGNYFESLEVINNIFKLDIETPKLYSLKAMNEISLEKYNEGLESVERGLKINSKDPKLNQIKANVLFKFHQYDKALDSINYAIELDPDFSDLDSRKNLVLKAWILFYKNDFNGAFDIVNEANERFPNFPEILEIGSLIYDLKGKYKESLNYLEKAEEAGGDISLYNIAQLLKNIKKYDGALEKINDAIKENPKEAVNYNLKAVILAEMEQYAEAEKTIDIAIKSRPKDKGFKSTKEQILQRQALHIANSGEKEKAIRLVKKVIELNPEWASKSYHVYGEILMNYEDYEGAIEKFELAKSLPFTPIETYIDLGKCYMELDKKEMALENLEIGINEATHKVEKMVVTDEGERIEKFFPQEDLIKKGGNYLAELKSPLIYVYIIEITSKDGESRFDIGFTHDLKESLLNIKLETPESVRLKYFEIFLKRADGKKRLSVMHKLSRSDKEDLIKKFDEINLN